MGIPALWHLKSRRYVSVFRRFVVNVSPLQTVGFEPFNMKPKSLVETSATTRPTTQRRNTGEQKPRFRGCENFKTHIQFVHARMRALIF
jgi:hypothetical protein